MQGTVRADPASQVKRALARNDVRYLAVVGMMLLASIARAGCENRPFAVLSTGGYKDGGTIAVAVTDSAGCAIEFCIDRRLTSPTPGAVYLNGSHPTMADPEPLGRLEVQSLLKLIKRVVETQYSEAELDSVLVEGFYPGSSSRVRSAGVLLNAIDEMEHWSR